jgi:class 3 adenylate cyclase
VAACPACGHENADGAKFCSECGAHLLAPTPRHREMRKTVTVVFCDVTGSTALGERLDPESLRGVMRRYFDRMKAVLESHGILAGDLDEAAHQLLEGCEQLQTLGETAMLSTAAAILTYVEIRRGDRDAAERWLAVAERTASADDRASQIGIEMGHGLLARARARGSGWRAAPANGARARRRDGCDPVAHRDPTRLARALPRDRPDEIARLAREALALAETKQVPMQIAAARGILTEMDSDA